jgi:hypothetical protein
VVTEEDSGTDVPRLVGETRHDGADSGVVGEKKQKKSQRFEPQTLCETADRLRILTTGGIRICSLLENFSNTPPVKFLGLLALGTLSSFKIWPGHILAVLAPGSLSPRVLDLGILYPTLSSWRRTDGGLATAPPVTSDKVTTRRLKARAPHAGSGLFHIEILCWLHPVLLGFTRFKEIGPERAIYCLV